MTETLTETLAALPSTPTVVPDQPMVWRHPGSGTLLANGGLLTGQQALAEAKAQFPNGHDFKVAGPVLSWTTIGRLTYVAEHPEPADAHAAAGDLESDLLALRVPDELAAQLAHAVRTAIEGGNPAEQLLQFLAAWSRGREYTAPDFIYPATELEEI